MPLLNEMLTIERLGQADSDRLGEFFAELAGDAETVRFFHPHPLTAAYAAALCARLGSIRDRYYALWDEGKMVGYMILRGWDEGYETPSFGVCVAPSRRRAGLGHWLLRHAMAECRRLGAQRLRLTVDQANVRAVHIYRKLGFRLIPKNADEFVGILDLTSIGPTWA